MCGLQKKLRLQMVPRVMSLGAVDMNPTYKARLREQITCFWSKEDVSFAPSSDLVLVTGFRLTNELINGEMQQNHV